MFGSTFAAIDKGGRCQRANADHASEKTKAVGSQQKRQRLCFRPPHVPPDTFRLSDRPVTELAPMPRLGKREVLLRLFYGGEMQKYEFGRAALASVFVFPPHPQEPCAPILFNALDERRPPTPPSPPAAALFRAPRGAKPAEPFSLCGARSNASRLFGTVAILRERATGSPSLPSCVALLDHCVPRLSAEGR